MKMIGVIWRNGALVSAVCFIGLLASATAQPADNTPTNQPVENAIPQQPAQSTVTNQTFEQEIFTNGFEFQPPAVIPAYGAQPVPDAFETQNNAPAVAGPSYVGGGQVISPAMGTGAFGLPGFALVGGPGLYQAGLLNIHAGLAYSFLYGTGLEDQPGQHNTATGQIVSPNVLVNLGSHLTLAYSAGLTFYSANSGLGDSTSQSANLLWSTLYEDWAFGLSQSYSYSSTPLIETGTQTPENDYVTGISVSRQLGSAFSVSLGLNQAFRLAQQFNDLYEWSANASINYTIVPKLQVGFSVGGGYNEVSDSPTMTFETYSVVLMAKPGPKTTVNLSAGIEQESFDTSAVPATISPIFSASIMYQMSKNTSLSLNAGESISPSFFSNLVTTATSVSAVLQHKLTTKLSVSLSGEYGSTSYQVIEPGALPKHFFGAPTVSALQVTRADDVSSIGIILNYAIRPHLNGSLSYSYSKNSSSQGEFTYDSSQVTVQLAYLY